MNEEKAEALAALLNGYVWQSGGGICLVLLDGNGGRKIAITDELICEYEDDEALERGSPLSIIRLA